MSNHLTQGHTPTVTFTPVTTEVPGTNTDVSNFDGVPKFVSVATANTRTMAKADHVVIDLHNVVSSDLERVGGSERPVRTLTTQYGSYEVRTVHATLGDGSTVIINLFGVAL